MKSFIKETDKILLALCVALSAVGILFVQTATARGEKFPPTRDAIVMAAAVALGIVAALVISVLNTGLFLRLWPLIAVISVGLMIITLLFGVGPASRSDAKTWLSLGGTGLYFQPSELVKIGFIITFSAHLDRVKDNLNKIRYIIPLMIHGAIPAGLVVISGDMGSALIFIMIFVDVTAFIVSHGLCEFDLLTAIAHSVIHVNDALNVLSDALLCLCCAYLAVTRSRNIHIESRLSTG